MSGIIIEKRLVDLVKDKLSKSNEEELGFALDEGFEDAYKFLLCESMDCEITEVPAKLRERLIKNDESNFTDSTLIFSDLTEAIELSLYKTIIYLVEELAENYLEDDDNYDIEENDLYIELMDIYSASIEWCDFEFDKERDTLSLTTYNFLDLKVKVEFLISRMSDKQYISNILSEELRKVLR